VTRVVSLLPSATEIVCALGLGESLVGVSHECDWPPEVRGKPVLTGSRDLTGTSGAIDRDVRALLRDALAIYSLDVDALRAAAPEVVVTQDLCKVCAVSYEAVCAAARELTLPGLEIISLRPTRLEHIWADVRTVAAALAVPERGEAVVAALLERVERVRVVAAEQEPRPRVLSVEWLDPIMIGGTWMPELIDLAGGVALAAGAGEAARTLSAADLADLDPAPDVVLLKPCGFPIARTLAEGDLIERVFAGLDWPALANGRVFVADGNAYFNRSGPRIVDSLELLAGCLHPRAFPQHVATYAQSVRSYS
jgi:iron complex transport system substrate-binding protein